MLGAVHDAAQYAAAGASQDSAAQGDDAVCRASEEAIVIADDDLDEDPKQTLTEGITAWWS